MRSYRELRRFDTLIDRFNYLKLGGQVGADTFGFDRHVNQLFYRSREWKQIRYHVIARDNGCDLGIEGYEINDGGLTIHHMNPITLDDLIDGNEDVLNPEYLITTTFTTHQAIHYGDVNLLPRPFVPRARGDTKLW